MTLGLWEADDPQTANQTHHSHSRWGKSIAAIKWALSQYKPVLCCMSSVTR